jgi:acetylornithine deacetylase/succinyl-diaminopimelate desuccinylase-like protein
MVLSQRAFLPALVGLASLVAGLTPVAAAPAPSEAERAEALELLKAIVSTRTVKGQGQTGTMAELLKARLIEAGFSEEAIDLPTTDIDGEPVTAFVVRYAAEGEASAPPIALLAHMDVVDASPETWSTLPFEPVVKDGYLYGRGVVDNKAGIGALVSTFARLKREGWAPSRDLVLAFSGDEETGMLTTQRLTSHPWIAGAAFALNSDAGSGSAGGDGKPPSFSIQSAEKTYATYVLTARNKGGHSSAPSPDNAIYDLSDALVGLRGLQFPVEFNEITRGMTERMAATASPTERRALLRLLDRPQDAKARRIVEESDLRAHFLSTTCVPTMLSGGVVENALPQRTSVTVNCRIMPGTDPQDVDAAIRKAVANDEIEVRPLGARTQSPVSPINESLFASLTNAARTPYPEAEVAPSMSSGGTDGREYRSAGIPTYGAGAIALGSDDHRAHGIDERLPLETYFDQIRYWETLLKDIAG